MPESEERIVRRILDIIDSDASVSQRWLSDEIGIAVGSANWYLKRCVNKGLIKLQRAPVKRYLYYLTPKGFEEKARLTASFLQSSFELYRLGRKQCTAFFTECANSNKRRIFLVGGGDFAEIAVLSALETGSRPVVIIDATAQGTTCASLPVVGTLSDAIAKVANRPPDAILLTNLQNPKKAYQAIVAQIKQMKKARLSPDLIHCPKILNLRIDK